MRSALAVYAARMVSPPFYFSAVFYRFPQREDASLVVNKVVRILLGEGGLARVAHPC